MIDLNRLPDTIPDNFRDADIDEAVSDVTSWNKDIEKATVKRYEQNTELRRSLAIMFTLTINGWLFAVFLILLTNNRSLKLSDSVLITLLTTTTIQVLGMMVIILWDLFPGGKKNNENNINYEI